MNLEVCDECWGVFFSEYSLQGILSEEEICELEKEFMAFIRREVHVEGRDFCDMSGDYSKPMESFSIINIMLPSKLVMFFLSQSLILLDICFGLINCTFYFN